MLKRIVAVAFMGLLALAVVLTNNTIAENLQCKENNPPPTGGGNRAGDNEDQCAAL